MSFADHYHATGDELEQYSMGRLAEPAAAGLEEHLLVCSHCQDRLMREDDFRKGMRDAGANWARQNEAPAGWKWPKLAWTFALAAAGMVALVGMQWPSLRHSGRAQTPAMVLLQATRGTESRPIAAPAGRPILLALDLTDLQQFSVYKVEIVDAGGRPAFQSDAVAHNNQLEAAVARGLPIGTYFVRIYSPTTELLREYALTVQG